MAEKKAKKADKGSADKSNKVQVRAQYLKDLSFENPNALQFLSEQKEAPTLSVNIEVQARGVAENMYEVVLGVTSEAKAKKDTVLLCEAQYAGVFEVAETDQEKLKQHLLIKCPEFLFPFARSIVASVTHESGFPPLMLEPVDFVQLYENQTEAA